jgi:hypothetical protein
MATILEIALTIKSVSPSLKRQGGRRRGIKLVKEIPLTWGQTALVDDEDYSLVSQYTWYAKKSRRCYYALTNQRKTLKHISMHRLIMNPKPDEEIDHINCIGTDNRRCNLRIVTHQQNHMNIKKQNICKKPYTSKYKGVSWFKRDSCWLSCINMNGKRLYLGSFDIEEDAAHAYDEAAKKYFGEYARLNLYPDEV